MLVHDLGSVAGLEVFVQHAFGVYDEDRPDGAGSEAAGLENLDFFVKFGLCQFFLQRGLDLQRAGRDAAAARAY